MTPNMGQNRQIICALDTADIEEAIQNIQVLRGHVGAFKIGHALTLNHGLSVVDRLRDAGADRIFLDLKFHDIPNSVALAVREAARRGVWMMTLHISGGPAMLTAAVEQARAFGEQNRPLLVGVSVLTSLDQQNLTHDLGVQRDLEDHVLKLSELAIQCEMDGVVCSAHEIAAVRAALGTRAVIVTPGIRFAQSDLHDQRRVGDASSALADGADYLVLGRPLTSNPNAIAELEKLNSNLS